MVDAVLIGVTIITVLVGNEVSTVVFGTAFTAVLGGAKVGCGRPRCGVWRGCPRPWLGAAFGARRN